MSYPQQSPPSPASPAPDYPAPLPQQAHPAPAYTPIPQQAYPTPAYAPIPQQAYPSPAYAPVQEQAYPAPAYAPVQPEATPAYGQVAVTSCRLCGSVPAAPAKFRGHQGFVVVMRFLSLDGPFCRDCGLATFRRMTSRTLVQGWYGYASFVITPITILINIGRRGKVASLPAPQPNPWGPSRPPMDPGPHLLARPMTIIGLGIPFVLIIGLIALIALNP